MTALAASSAISATRAPDRFNTVACLAVGAAIMGYCVAEPAPALAAFSLPVLFLGWWLSRDGAPTALPRAAINLLVIAAIARAFFSVTGSGNPVVSHLSEFLVLIQLIKLFDRKTTRDEAQLLSLSLFIVIGALLTSNTLGVGFLLLLYTPLATAAAMLLQIRAGLTRAQASQNGAAPAPGTRRRLASNLARPGPRAKAARRQFRAVVAGAVVLSFVLALVAFLLTPRGLGQDRLGRLGQTRAGATIGFSDQVHLGRSGFLQQQQTPVMDVALFDDSGNEIGSEHRSLYLRGAVLTNYDPAEGEWAPHWNAALENGLEFHIRPGERTTITRGDPGPMLVRQDISLRSSPPPGKHMHLFAMWTPVALETHTRDAIGFLSPDLTLKRRSTGGRFRYTVWSDPRGAGFPARGILFRPALENLRRGPNPFADGPVRRLAEQLLAAEGIPLDPAQRTAPDNRAAAAAFVTYLRNNYEYTLEMVPPQKGRDAIEWFLFDRKKGHCEFFASALVALCQSVDLDARLVTGYLTTEYNPVTRQYIVRQSHAHAWAEVNIDGRRTGRWQTMDPSPPAAIEQNQRRGGGLIGWLRQIYDAIDFAWNDAVVSFDESRRADLLGGLFGGGRFQMGMSLRSLSDRISAALSPNLRGSTAGVWLILVGLAMIAASISIVAPAWLRRLRGRARRAPAAADPHLRGLLAGAQFYDRALALLARAGMAKPDSRPPIAHAATLAPANPHAADDLRRLATLYYHVRFGHRPLSAGESAAADDALRSLRERLTGPRGKTP